MADGVFLVPKPIEYEADLSNQWAWFLKQLKLYLVTTVKGSKSNKVRIALMFKYIGPRRVDIFKSFTFTGDKYDDVIEKFQAFCLKTAKNDDRKQMVILWLKLLGYLNLIVNNIWNYLNICWLIQENSFITYSYYCYKLDRRSNSLFLSLSPSTK